ncbi:MAG: lysophospholipid acyltransferase family protein, partial [Deltaproteobacteria bacterium]|nr:lysophospholipid acyltransferase family protein [Deltaproteobacteria bacterium]
AAWMRTRSGNNVVGKKWAMRGLMQILACNGMLAVLMDQNVTRKEGVFVDFFGIPACTNKGLALLSRKTGAAVLPIFILRDGRTHRIIIEHEVPLLITGDKEADTIENTRRFTKRIEDMIRKYPGQWFWVHRRWKTRLQA